MSDLREAIKAIQIIDPHDSTVGETLTEGQLNAIIDAVIAVVRNDDRYDDNGKEHTIEFWSGMTVERIRILKELETAKEEK